jgi:hypothetical protein
MMVADHRLAAHSGLSLREALRLANGGINVEVVIAAARRQSGR